MLRSSLFTASAFAFVASASAQTPQTLQAERITGPIKNAGIYHVATGTWTRTGGAVANLGPDVIYSNTTATGYFTSAGGAGGFAPDSVNHDEGGLPGSTNTNVSGVTNDEYFANCFSIGYCDNGLAASGGWAITFYESYTPCTLPDPANGEVPVGAFLATGLPAGGCWTVELDLSGGLEFCIGADNPLFPGFDDDANLDSFGWSYQYAGTDGSAPAGFIMAGDPQYTDLNWIPGGLPLDGSGTFYGAASPCATPTDENGTGYLTDDFWWLEDPLVTDTGCYFFGGYINRNGCGGPQGNPYASFFMQIEADILAPCVDPNLGVEYCQSNPNSTGATTDLVINGSTSVAADNMTLNAVNMPNNSFGFFITSETQGFVANPAGSQGNICLAGNLGRFVATGQIKNSMMAGTISLATPTEWTTTAIPTSTGPYAAAVGITTNFQAWHRDVGSNSNFSNAREITWTP
ncbi:MAG: hypothetical protein AAGI22_17160 [Planctomycetota bacterium]